MERLNWALLGVMGVVTALGLSTSSSAGKAKTNDQAVSVAALTTSPPCSACRGHAATETSVTVTPATTNATSSEACAGNCQATGVCCDKTLSKKDGAVSIARTGEVFEFTIPADKKPGISTAPVCEGECLSGITGNSQSWVISGTGECKSVPGVTTSTECPLAKAGEGLLNLTKNFVCEGGECLTKQGHGTLTITTVEPAPTQPEGLSNLLAAAEAVKPEAKPDGTAIGVVTGGLTIEAKPTLNFTTGTLTITGTADTKSDTVKLEAKAVEVKPVIDNSRAAARAAKLAQLEAKMTQPWTLAFNETPLIQAVEALQTKLGVPVLLDLRALEDIGLDPSTPLTANQQPEIETGDFLRDYLRNHSLTWMIPASNDRILITSLQAMEGMPINRVYDATDLIDENLGPDVLIERIQALVEPQSWKAAGGNGDLTIWQKGNRVSLICSNTYWAHRSIATLLEDLRLNSGEAGGQAAIRAKQPEVAVLKNYELPSLLNINEQKDKQRQLDIYKQSLLNVLKNEPGFESAVFETLEFGNRTVLMTKQLPAVHQQIQRVLLMLKQNPGIGGGSIIPVVGNANDPVCGGFFSR